MNDLNYLLLLDCDMNILVIFIGDKVPATVINTSLLPIFHNGAKATFHQGLYK